MGLTLIFSGKVQVDIRLLVSLEAKEGFKRDVKAILHQGFPANRAELIRHIAACIAGILLYLRRIKVIVMAIWTSVVGA